MVNYPLNYLHRQLIKILIFFKYGFRSDCSEKFKTKLFYRMKKDLSGNSLQDSKQLLPEEAIRGVLQKLCSQTFAKLSGKNLRRSLLSCRSSEEKEALTKTFSCERRPFPALSFSFGKIPKKTCSEEHLRAGASVILIIKLTKSW